MSVRETIDQGVENLYPGYFALVMATGIVSIAIHLLQISSGIAWLLFQINKAAYGILWILTLFRLIRFHERVLSDLADDGRGPGFFTVVAGTAVLGSQFVFLSGDFVTGTLFWFLGLFLWFLLTYGFLTAVIAREAKPKSPEAIHGGWLVAVVATQSISVLGIMIAAHWEKWQEVLLFFALLMFLLGCMQ